MILIDLRFTHHSPKDSETGTKELLIAESIEQALPYIDSEHLRDYLKESKHDEDNGYHSVSDEWWEQNPGRKEEAEAMDLTVGEHGDVEGPAHLLTLWWQGTTWKDTDDAFYGVTHHEWSIQKPLAEEETTVLLRLGLAKDIRNWKPEDSWKSEGIQ